jgi:hypothetical protein
MFIHHSYKNWALYGIDVQKMDFQTKNNIGNPKTMLIFGIALYCPSEKSPLAMKNSLIF